MGRAIIIAVIVACVAVVIALCVVVGYRLVSGDRVRRSDLRRARSRYVLAESALFDVATTLRDDAQPAQFVVDLARDRITEYDRDSRRFKLEID